MELFLWSLNRLVFIVLDNGLLARLRFCFVSALLFYLEIKKYLKNIKE